MKTAAVGTALFILFVGSLHAQFPVNPTADRVLGQGNFTTDTFPATTQASTGDPSGIAVDPVSGKVFVSITGQHRILRFASSAAVANGANAEAVIGQTNYTSDTSGISASTFNRPQGIDIDSAGRLWVADYQNFASSCSRTRRTCPSSVPPPTSSSASPILSRARPAPTRSRWVALWVSTPTHPAASGSPTS